MGITDHKIDPSPRRSTFFYLHSTAIITNLAREPALEHELDGRDVDGPREVEEDPLRGSLCVVGVWIGQGFESPPTHIDDCMDGHVDLRRVRICMYMYVSIT